MFDVYVNDRSALVVVRSGASIPAGLTGVWRLRKRRTRTVSATIRQDVKLTGFHHRRLTGNASHRAASDARDIVD